MTGTTIETEEFKMTEIGALPFEWEVANLGNLVKSTKGKKPHNMAKVTPSNSLPYLTAVYFRTGQATHFVSLDVNVSLVLVENNDVVFIWDGSNAGDVFTGLKGVLASTMVKITPEDSNTLDKKYLFYFLKNRFDLFNSTTTGSTIPHVNKKVFQDLSVPVPPLPEQKKIAYVLSTVQAAIGKTEAVIKATRALKKSLMKHLFTYGPVSIDEAKNVPLKETEIGTVPEEWDIVRLRDVGTIVMGQSPPGSTYNDKGSGAPFLQGKAEFCTTSPKHVKYTTKPLKTAPKGSVLMSVRAPVGDVNIADIDYCIGRGLASLSLDEGDNAFLFYVLSYRKSDIEKEGTGSTFKAINKSKLEEFEITFPSYTAQRKIAETILSVDQKAQVEENKKQALEALFKTLLTRFMTGKIRVSSLEVPV